MRKGAYIHFSKPKDNYSLQCIQSNNVESFAINHDLVYNKASRVPNIVNVNHCSFIKYVYLFEMTIKSWPIRQTQYIIHVYLTAPINCNLRKKIKRNYFYEYNKDNKLEPRGTQHNLVI